MTTELPEINPKGTLDKPIIHEKEDISGYPDLNITIGFSTTNSWTSKLIRWFTNSKISHSFVAINLFGARIIIGAESYGLDWRTKARFEQKNSIKAVYKPIALPVQDSFAWFVREYAGAAYDWGAAGATGIRAKLGALWKYIKGWFTSLPSKDRLMCEEVPTRLLQHAGYTTVKDIDPELTSAEVLMQLCDRSSEFKLEWKAPDV